MISSSWRRALVALALLAGSVGPGRSQSSDNSGARKFRSPDEVAALVAALEKDPQDQRAVRGAEAVVEDGLPDVLQSDWLPHLPVEAASLPGGLGTRVVPSAYLPTPTAEPQHGWAFSRVAYVYVPTGEAGVNRLLCRLHTTQPADAPLAARVGALLALAHRTLVERTDREAEGGAAPFDVWLCRRGQSGGEQWHGNIYFYDLDSPRSSIEWIREVVHEYGHLALPPIGGYTAPEYWANGYYGERLIVRWIARTPGGPALVRLAWGDFSGWSNFQRLLIAPAIALYVKTGPSPSLAARRDETGMRYLIGQMLVFDDRYGAKRLGEAFSFLPHAREARGPDFGAAVAQALPRQARRRP